MDPKDDPKDDRTPEDQRSDSDTGDEYDIYNESEQPLTLTQPGLRYPGYGKPGHVPPQPRVPLPYPEDVDSIERQAQETDEVEGMCSGLRKKRRRHAPKMNDVGEAAAAAAEDGAGTGTVSGSQPTGGACPRGLYLDLNVAQESTSSETSSSSLDESEESAVDLSKDFSD